MGKTEYEHPWQWAFPRWYEWSMTVHEDWKAWLGFAIPMLVLTAAIAGIIIFPIIYGIFWAVAQVV